MSLFDRDDSARRLPVSLITGFLGSGKTTLLNRLLRDPAMADSAVIVNEFGEIGLDHLLMERIDGETVLMASGCLCCTVRSDLEKTLRELDWKRRDGTVPPFQRVLVETTGLADPAPILQLLLNHPFVGASYRLDAVVATVDTLHAMRQLDEHAESVKQVALADRLVLTKGDLAAADDEALAVRLRALNPAAPQHHAVNGAIAADRLFGAALYDPARRAPDARAWLQAEAYAHDDEHHDHAHDVNRHDARIAAFCMVEDQPIDWDRFHRWLGQLRAERGQDLLRVKGILNLAGEATPVAIHGVHHVFHPPVQLADWPDADRRSRIVFITRDLPGPMIAESWQRVRG
jgi:G3E family GTPase